MEQLTKNQSGLETPLETKFSPPNSPPTTTPAFSQTSTPQQQNPPATKPPHIEESMWSAFQNIITFISLAFFAGSLHFLWSLFISHWLPTAKNELAGAPSSYGLNGSISTLLVSAPFFIFLFINTNKKYVQEPKLKKTRSKKILNYIVLVVTFIILLVRTISAINTALNDAFTINFGLNLLITFIISGTIFIYYLYEVKIEKQIASMPKYIVGSVIISLVAIATLITSLFVRAEVKEQKERLINQVRIPTPTTSKPNQINTTPIPTVQPLLTTQPITIPSDWQQFTATDPDFGVKTAMSMPPGYSFRFTGSEFTIQNDSDATELWDYSTSIFRGKDGLKNYYAGNSRRVWYQELLDGKFMLEKPYQFIPGEITNTVERQIGSQSYLEVTVSGGPPANYLGEVGTHYIYAQNSIIHIVKPTSHKANSTEALIPNHIGTIFASLTSSSTK